MACQSILGYFMPRGWEIIPYAYIYIFCVVVSQVFFCFVFFHIEHKEF